MVHTYKLIVQEQMNRGNFPIMTQIQVRHAKIKKHVEVRRVEEMPAEKRGNFHVVGRGAVPQEGAAKKSSSALATTASTCQVPGSNAFGQHPGSYIHTRNLRNSTISSWCLVRAVQCECIFTMELLGLHTSNMCGALPMFTGGTSLLVGCVLGKTLTKSKQQARGTLKRRLSEHKDTVVKATYDNVTSSGS